MDHQFRFTAEKIRKRIELVSDHRFREAVALEPFRYRELAEPTFEPDLATNANDWEEVSPGTYWAGADTHFTLRTRFDLPREWTNPALHLPLGSLGDIFNHPESLLYVDGKILGSADRHHHTIALDGIDPGPHELTLHGWTGL
ncbi:MAG: alpha-mannosidase, partial [Rhizobiaceae bacterium]|nr:alpha-mannosidase [Rhizobiaceae bacterium]